MKMPTSFSHRDGELELRLVGNSKATMPDNTIDTLHFKMINTKTNNEMGELNCRLGYSENIVQYRGNIGFTVYEQFRGHEYAKRSCLLLVKLLQDLDLSVIWLTCNKNNIPSKKTIENIGATFVEIKAMPESYEFLKFYPQESRVKLRYRWNI